MTDDDGPGYINELLDSDASLLLLSITTDDNALGMLLLLDSSYSLEASTDMKFLEEDVK